MEEVWGNEQPTPKKNPANALFQHIAGFCILNLVPRAGVEPARVAPLVFETSASTDSAIWAQMRCKDTRFF